MTIKMSFPFFKTLLNKRRVARETKQALQAQARLAKSASEAIQAYGPHVAMRIVRMSRAQARKNG